MKKYIMSIVSIGILFIGITKLQAEGSSEHCDNQYDSNTTTQEIVLDRATTTPDISISTSTEDLVPTSNKDVSSTISSCIDCNIYINEIFPNPIGADTGEFIELYNADNKSISIEGWTLQDASAKKYILTGSLDSLSYLVLYKDQTGISLNNTGLETVTLLDTIGNGIDTVNYTDSFEGQSLNNINNQYEWSEEITPNLKNIRVVTPIDEKKLEVVVPEVTIVTSSQSEKLTIGNNDPFLLDGLIITEIYPNPIGVDMLEEFIELYNSSTSSINMGGYYLDDIDGGSPPFIFMDGTVIHPGEFVSFGRGVTNIALNNTDDEVRILDSKKNEIKKVTYTEAKEGFSYSFFANQYLWTDIITKETENKINEEAKEITSNQIVPLEEIASYEIGSLVTVEGAVSVAQGILGSQYFYIQDGVGIQIYMYKKDFPQMNIGNMVRVTGELSSSSSGLRIKTTQKNDIVLLSNNKQIIPIKKEIEAIDYIDVGSLVTISGISKNKTINGWIVDDGTGEMEVYIKSGTDIDKPKIDETINLSITGIIIADGDTYKILPRNQQDILVEIPEVLSTEDSLITTSTPAMTSKDIIQDQDNTNGIKKYLLIVITLSGFGLIGMYIKKKYFFETLEKQSTLGTVIE